MIIIAFTKELSVTIKNMEKDGSTSPRELNLRVSTLTENLTAGANSSGLMENFMMVNGSRELRTEKDSGKAFEMIPISVNGKWAKPMAGELTFGSMETAMKASSEIA